MSIYVTVFTLNFPITLIILLSLLPKSNACVFQANYIFGEMWQLAVWNFTDGHPQTVEIKSKLLLRLQG